MAKDTACIFSFRHKAEQVSKRKLKGWNHLDRIQTKVEKMILSYAVLFMALILIGNVVSRSIFNRSWTFAEESGQFLVLLVMLYSSYPYFH